MSLHDKSLPERAREIADHFSGALEADEMISISPRSLRTLIEAATWWEDAALEVEYRWYRLQLENWRAEQPQDIVDFATQFTALSDAHLALRTFLTGHDGEYDTMPWERDEEL